MAGFAVSGTSGKTTATALDSSGGSAFATGSGGTRPTVPSNHRKHAPGRTTFQRADAADDPGLGKMVRPLPKLRAPAVKPGDEVGYLVRGGSTEPGAPKSARTSVTPVRAEKVVGTFNSPAAAEKAARSYSAAHGGENVAVVEKTTYRLEAVKEPRKPARGRQAPGIKPYGTDDTLLRGQRLVPVKTYTVVTLDPGVDPSHAGELHHDNRPNAPRIVSVGNDRGMVAVPDKGFDAPRAKPIRVPPVAGGGPCPPRPPIGGSPGPFMPKPPIGGALGPLPPGPSADSGSGIVASKPPVNGPTPPAGPPPGSVPPAPTPPPGSVNPRPWGWPHDPNSPFGWAPPSFRGDPVPPLTGGGGSGHVGPHPGGTGGGGGFRNRMF